MDHSRTDGDGSLDLLKGDFDPKRVNLLFVQQSITQYNHTGVSSTCKEQVVMHIHLSVPSTATWALGSRVARESAEGGSIYGCQGMQLCQISTAVLDITSLAKIIGDSKQVGLQAA